MKITMNNYFEESEKIVKEIENKIEKENRLKPALISELMSKEFGEIEWVAEPLIPKEAITILSGDPASFKTWLILDLAKKIAEGGLWLDYFIVYQQSVLIIDEENPERLIQKRMKELKLDSSLPIYLLSLRDFKLVDDDVEYIIKFSQEKNIKVIFFDSLIRIHSSDENDAVKMASVFNQFKKFCKAGISIVITHHNRKENSFQRGKSSQSMRGSSDILAAVDSHISVSRDNDFLKIEQTKLRQAEEFTSFRVDIVKEESGLKFQFAGEIDEVKEKKELAKGIIKNIMTNQTELINKSRIVEMVKKENMDIGDRNIRTAINEMIEANKLYSIKGKGNADLCSVNPISPEVGQLQIN